MEKERQGAFLVRQAISIGHSTDHHDGRLISIPIGQKAEGGGFEPPRTCALSVFKTDAIGHSATPPNHGDLSSHDTWQAPQGKT